MNQTKLQSLIEAIFNTAIGFVIGILSQMLIFPLLGMTVSFQTNLWIGFWFTIISVIRTYVVRRWFNERLRKAAQAIANI
ncbi:hypothetical protein KAZ66_00010 [Candidatus Woesebacteria bacterium]|jgi:membrane protein implicated in regulation of membrane protease activity|nr:hypothetical protein [Candidatus Woesebacteria bacterium]